MVLSDSIFQLPSYQPEKLRHILLGDYAAAAEAINRVTLLHYCERIVWITPIPTGRGSKYISVMACKRGTFARWSVR